MTHPILCASRGLLANGFRNNGFMPKPSPKLDPATDAVLRRMLATPPHPHKPVKQKTLSAKPFTSGRGLAQESPCTS
jgi:hypothetical protein